MIMMSISSLLCSRWLRNLLNLTDGYADDSVGDGMRPVKEAEEVTTLETVLHHLPPSEAQHYILKWLDKNSLLSMRCVSKQFRRLVDPILEFHVELSDGSMEHVLAFGDERPVKCVATTSFQKDYPVEGISINTEMLRITVNDPDGGDGFFQEFRQRKRQWDKQEATRYTGISQQNFPRLIQDFYFVQKLNITSLAVKSFADPKVLSSVDLPNVNEMIITFFDGGHDNLVPFLRNHFPTLKSVKIANEAESLPDRPFIYSWIYGFVANHYDSLDTVTLIFPEGKIVEHGQGLGTSISSEFRNDHRMPQCLYEAAKSKLEKLQLDKFILGISILEGRGRYDMGMTILRSQTQLTELHLDNLHIKDLPLWRKMGPILEKLSATLISLSLGGCFCGPASIVGLHSFNCSWVKDCEKLKKFEMVVSGVTVQCIPDLPKKSLTHLNLGYMLSLDQIEHIALNMVNLETLVLQQRGSLMDFIVPKITRHLFEVVLHLPKLTKVNLWAECCDKDKILEFVASEEGITRCGHVCLMDDERNDNITFHINRGTFFREHSNLRAWIESNRPATMRSRHVIELVVRHLHLVDQDEGAHFLDWGSEDEQDRDGGYSDDDDYFF